MWVGRRDFCLSDDRIRVEQKHSSDHYTRMTFDVVLFLGPKIIIWEPHGL